MPTKALTVVAIGLGVAVMSLRGGTGQRSVSAPALAYALGTASFTAAYTLVDAVGARLSDAASGFTRWMFVLDGLAMLAFGLRTRGAAALIGLTVAWRSGAWRSGAWRSGLAAGAMPLRSYWIAIWAFTKAPVALVAALRETSVLFAVLIAVLFLKEPAGPWRWTAAVLIGAGAMLLRL